MDDLKTVVLALLAPGRTHDDLAKLVDCSPSTISMIATGKRGTRTSFYIENRLRQLHTAQQTLQPR
jgi:hypothetical protein